MIRATLCTILLIFATLGVYGQSVEGQPAFEVASIKPSAPPNGGRMRVGSSGGPGTSDPGQFTCQNCSLSNLVSMAYGLKRYQLPAANSFESDRFDIMAKIPEGATKEQFRLMQQNLLTERFKLKFHYEKKEMPIYELVVAKGGAKLKESMEEPAPEAGAQSGPPPRPASPPKIERDSDGFPVLPPGRTPMMIMMNGRASMRAVNQSTEQIANTLSNQVGRPVTDATGLTSKYDFTLTWVAESMPGSMARPAPPAGGGPPVPSLADSDPGLTIFGAIQAQLGLKLDQKKGEVDIMIIDHLEKIPTEN